MPNASRVHRVVVDGRDIIDLGLVIYPFRSGTGASIWTIWSES